jgi:hypothetical protein
MSKYQRPQSTPLKDFLEKKGILWNPRDRCISGCVGCCEGEPTQPDKDDNWDEQFFDCLLLNKQVWAEEPECKDQDWIEAAKQELLVQFKEIIAHNFERGIYGDPDGILDGIKLLLEQLIKMPEGW